MKRSLILCFILTCSIAFAQSDLFVSNGSFIYVDGDGFTPGPNVAPVFVTNDVNIEGGGHIYLRNEAQLLQGNDVGNSGLGELSVYQEGNVNRWSYNYWCSPVGVPNVANGNEPSRVSLLNDVIDVTNSTPALFTPGFDGIGSPLTISDRWLWSFVSSDEYSEWIYVGSTNDLDPGLGFTMKGNGTTPTESQLYDFRGKPNNGTITNPVANGQWTLIGNPYPSAIDARDLIHNSSNVNEITGTLFYWEQSQTVTSHVLQDYIGGYATYTINTSGAPIETFTFALFSTYDENDNSTPVYLPPPAPPFTQAEGVKRARRYIPIGQGFMVEGINGPNGEVTVNNSMREFVKEDGTNSVFFRNGQTNAASNSSNETGVNHIQYQDNGLSLVPDDYKRFRVNVDFTVGESQYTRQLVLNFHDSATFGHDRGLELKRAQAYDSDAYFELDGEDYGAQAYPFGEDLRIPLVIDIEEQQPLRFRIFDIQNFEDSQGIYIYDSTTDMYINLRDINYELNIEPGHYTDRFEVVFTAETTLSNEAVDLDNLSVIQNNGLHQLQIFNPNAVDISSIEVYDVSGRRVITNPVNTVESQYNISTLDLSDGVYVVNIKTASEAVTSDKVIVKN
ncbi:T9SS type A sorting domain-containing protein [Winogradskyella sp. DF17]|uniref:T9SS type A sorting domain-containing protein n=1 Tax=Winogradskyella pelagia TaxID=2819984 RepID=A0ABS3T0S9_9FLAO|nr:T9SS type A sorting domain-containing protein [Winogradskyella sp. DF17]MBO3116347.1 T9SS type A sorting domain-containing protein [Winogradskyella sp. DF17]